jgi:hypothetical protein
MTVLLYKKIKKLVSTSQKALRLNYQEKQWKKYFKSKTHTKPINTLFGNNVEFLNIKVINSDGVKLTGHEGRKRNEKLHKSIN